MNETKDEELRELTQRLSATNNYFGRRASEVLTNEAAVRLIARMFEDKVMDKDKLDLGGDGEAFALLNGAAFCEIGANVYYITDAGMRFVQDLLDAPEAEEGDKAAPATDEPAHAKIGKAPTAQREHRAEETVQATKNISKYLFELIEAADQEGTQIPGIEHMEAAASTLLRVGKTESERKKHQ